MNQSDSNNLLRIADSLDSIAKSLELMNKNTDKSAEVQKEQFSKICEELSYIAVNIVE